MEPEPSPQPSPIAFVAIAKKNLPRGDLIQFYIDLTGKITSPQVDFVQPMTPLLTRKLAAAEYFEGAFTAEGI